MGLPNKIWQESVIKFSEGSQNIFLKVMEHDEDGWLFKRFYYVLNISQLLKSFSQQYRRKLESLVSAVKDGGHYSLSVTLFDHTVFLHMALASTQEQLFSAIYCNPCVSSVCFYA